MEERQFQMVAKALAEPRRFAILQAITRAGEIACGQLAALFPVGQPTVSHHVAVLERAGLVRVRRRGQHAFFSPVPQTLAEYVEELHRRLAFPGVLPQGGGEDKEKGGNV